MQVFKLCIKIAKKNTFAFVIYVLIFVIVCILNSVSASNSEISYTQTKSNIAFFDNDNTVFTQGLKKSLEKYAYFIEVENSEKELQDALFFREIVYVIEIPNGFTEKFINGENISINTHFLPGTYTNTYIEMATEEYLNNANIYLTGNNKISQEQLTQKLLENLSVETTVNISEKSVGNKNAYAISFFNFLSYAMLSIIIYMVSTIIFVVNDFDKRNRMLCTPVSNFKINLQTVLSNIFISLFVWLLLCIICCLITPNITTKLFIILSINALVYSIICATLAFLIGSVIKSKDTINAFANVLTLAFSFVSGSFVPQSVLDDTVLGIAHITPSYYFVCNNNMLMNFKSFSDIPSEFFTNIIIQIAFSAAFFTTGLLITKTRKSK